jgi:two-component system sensor histidine kinase/response regulator
MSDPGTGKRILVVDDEELVRTTMAEILQEEGYELDVADDGEHGLTRVRALRPDLIICDVNMPGMDGYQMLHALQSDPDLATIPFLFLTGYSDVQHFRHGMKLGADDYLTKPVSSTDLISAVRKRLAKHRAVRAQTERKLDELRANVTLALPHELRTPLHTILSYAGLLIKDHESVTPGDVATLGRTIQRSAEALQRLIENFIIVAQLEVIASDQRQMAEMRSMQTEDVLQLVESEAALRGEAHSRSDDLAVHGSAVAAAAGAASIGRIVSELIDNALRYSERGSPVVVKVLPGASACMISVTDQGRGMTKEQVEALGAHLKFNRRVREQGMGLGFTIAQRLSELHGGECTVESEPNRGTTVSVSLPLAPTSSAGG